MEDKWQNHRSRRLKAHLKNPIYGYKSSSDYENQAFIPIITRVIFTNYVRQGK
jgi:hypothetical protein